MAVLERITLASVTSKRSAARRLSVDRLLAAVNFGTVPVPCACPPGCHGGRSWLSTDPDRADGDMDLDGFTLESSEAVLLLV
jgi:hypothetical protein